jgi:hypothetical protein
MSSKKPNIKPDGATKPPAPSRPPVVMSGAGEAAHFVVTKAEAQRVLAWFGSATIAAPGDFELAARIRRAFE